MKIIGRLLLLAIVGFIVLGVIAYFNLKSQAPPDIEKAEYALQAYYQWGDDIKQKIPTRYYYAEAIEIEKGKAILTGYWTYDGKRYVYHEGEKPIDPPFDIIQRGRR